MIWLGVWAVIVGFIGIGISIMSSSLFIAFSSTLLLTAGILLCNMFGGREND